MYNKTLYYPWIDIRDDSWAKTAILYWDEINTIVPYGIHTPYRSSVAELLRQERILLPFYVDQHSQEVKEASDIALQYLSTPEGLKVLTAGSRSSRIHPQKLSYHLQHTLGLRKGRLHADKMTDTLRETMDFARVDDDGFISMEGKFAAYYMSALANRVAKYNNLSTVADSQVYNQFNTKLSADGYTPQSKKTFIRCPACRELFDRFTQETVKSTGECPACGEVIFYYFEQDNVDRTRPYRAEPKHLVDGLLAEIAIESIYIPSSVSVEKMLDFRLKYNDELSAFRGAMQGITGSILDSGDVDDMRVLRDRVKVAYKDRVVPSIKALKSQLKNAKINYVLSDFTISGMASILGISAATSVAGTALLAGTGVSIGVRTLMYMKERRSLQTNPYSYVLSMENKLK